jgi:hypothetical protein
MHKGTSLQQLDRGKELLSAAQSLASESERELILQNVHHFALSRKVLEEVNAALFCQKAQPTIYALVKEAKDTFHAHARKVKAYLDPLKKKLKELQDLDRDTQFIQSLDDFFELNAQIVSNVERVSCQKNKSG